jgi:hypothetical protein
MRRAPGLCRGAVPPMAGLTRQAGRPTRGSRRGRPARTSPGTAAWEEWPDVAAKGRAGLFRARGPGCRAPDAGETPRPVQLWCPVRAKGCGWRGVRPGWAAPVLARWAALALRHESVKGDQPRAAALLGVSRSRETREGAFWEFAAVAAQVLKTRQPGCQRGQWRGVGEERARGAPAASAARCPRRQTDGCPGRVWFFGGGSGEAEPCIHAGPLFFSPAAGRGLRIFSLEGVPGVRSLPPSLAAPWGASV